jgi:sirohydrochlorin cobaltochelatase
MKDLTMLQGTILFAHGSRDPLWRKPVEAVARRVQALDANRRVGCAYLEITEPNLETCAAELIGQGVKAVNVVPLFLGVGKHAREDLPVLMAGLKTRYPDIHFSLQNAVGEDERLLDLLADIALAPAPSGSPQFPSTVNGL